VASGGVNANINIAVKNLQALDRLNKNLEASAKAQQKLVTGLDRVSQRLSKINSQGNVFGKIGRDAGGAVKSVGKLQQSLSKMAGLSKAGGGATGKGIFAGILTSGAGAALTVNGVTNAVNGLIGGLGRSITPTTGVAAALNNMGAALSAHPALWGAAAIAAMAFGDKILPATVGTFKAVGQLGQALNKTSKDFALAKATAIDFNIGIINVKKQIENMVRGASLNEIRTLVNQSKNEMEGFWSMTRGAEQAAIKLAAALKAQKKEQAAIDDLLRAAQGRVRKADLPTKKESKSAQIAYKAAQWRKKELKLTQDRIAAEVKASQQQMRDIAMQEAADRKRLARADALQKKEEARARAERRGRIGENLMLGAGFPMLFGGGVGAVGGGVLGAGAQGLMGGQGFGAQILLSALGQQIDAFVGKISTLGKAFNEINPDVNAVIKSLGETNTAYGNHLEILKKLKGEAAAMAAATKKLAGLIGKQGVAGLKEFGKDTQRFANEWTKFSTLVMSSLAQWINATGILKKLTDAVARSVNFKSAKRAANEGDKGLAILFAQRSGIKERTNKGSWKERQRAEEELKIQDNLINQAEIKRQGRVTGGELYGKGTSKVEELKLEQQFLKENMLLTEKEFAIEVQVRELKKAGEVGDETELRNGLRKIQQLKEERQEVVAIREAWKGINQSIRDDITQGIKGLIKGTATWADMLNNIADKFLDMALNQALYGNIMGEFSKGSGIFGKIFGFANGGSPPVGKPSIVGEKGPELFVPSSSGKIVPNHELGGGGSVNVTVNVDASGTDVQGDDSQAKQLGTMLSAAVQAELVKQKRPGGLLAGVA